MKFHLSILIFSSLCMLISCSFIAEPKGKKPEVISISPQSCISSGERLRIVFSEEMNKTSVERGFSFTGPKGQTGGIFKWEDKTTLFFQPSGIESPYRYILIIEEATSVHGLPMAQTYSRYFSTVTNGASPSLISCTPALHAEDVPVEQNIRLEFSAAIDRESFYRAFRLLPSVEGSFAWEDDEKVIHYEIDKELEKGREYRIEIDDTCTDREGRPLDSRFSSTFTTVESENLVCTEISPESTGDSLPADTETLYGIEKEETLGFSFSRAPEKAERDNIFSLSSGVSYTLQWNERGDTAYLSFTEPLLWQEVYIITVLGAEYMCICNGPESRPVKVEKVYFCNDVDASDPSFSEMTFNRIFTPEASEQAALDIYFSHSPEAELTLTGLLDKIDIRAGNGSASIREKELLITPENPSSPNLPETSPGVGYTSVRLLFSIVPSGKSGEFIIEVSDDMEDSLGNTLDNTFYLSMNL